MADNYGTVSLGYGYQPLNYFSTNYSLDPKLGQTSLPLQVETSSATDSTSSVTDSDNGWSTSQLTDYQTQWNNQFNDGKAPDEGTQKNPKSLNYYTPSQNVKTRAAAWKEARDAGAGVFKWKGKLYNTMQKDVDNIEDFRKTHRDFDYFLGSDLQRSKSVSGWEESKHPETQDNSVAGGDASSYTYNKVPSPEVPKTPSVKPENKPTTPDPVRLDMFTDDDIRNMHFNDYQSMVNAISSGNYAENNFAKAMISKFGDNTKNWNQSAVENFLGVKGKYRSFGRGDFGDMSRAMASYIGTQNANYDKASTGKDGVVYSSPKVKNLFDNAGNASTVQNNQETFQVEPNRQNPYLTQALQMAFKPKNSVLTQYQLGGSLKMRINYFQAGGAVAPQTTQQSEGQDIQAQVIQLVQAAMQGDEKATQTVQQIMEAAKQGDEQAAQIAQLIQAVVQQMQGQAQAAKRGAKLSYLHSLKTGCPEGYSVSYNKKGGHLCKECIKQDEEGSKVTTKPTGYLANRKDLSNREKLTHFNQSHPYEDRSVDLTPSERKTQDSLYVKAKKEEAVKKPAKKAKGGNLKRKLCAGKKLAEGDKIDTKKQKPTGFLADRKDLTNAQKLQRFNQKYPNESSSVDLTPAQRKTEDSLLVKAKKDGSLERIQKQRK